ncbi:DUF4382 domain-containing protein [Proteiniphilum sp.]|uniref:DUF4382 domain-containing protein n=1 Tax=Proteiniphilum sp. TaxID=1926877 RepID=UPI002B1FC0A1|nr:DUF4382 domain-containing protein [Proteiniphilum sp.]MEA4918370.1 DUF4382 domain-containing protein [Proteiniphilum sp.]
MRYKLFRYILFIVPLYFLWQACDGDDPSVNASRLRLKLTDATSLVLKEFHVDIKEISVFLVDTVSNEGEWKTLEFSGKSYDILKLTNGKTVQLVDQYVPAGTKLQQVKLLFGDDNRMVTNTNNVISLHIPTELQGGIVIDVIGMEMRLNTISSMIIDLNAAFSFRELNGTYFLYPEARAFPETYGGKLKGQVAPIEASPSVAIVHEKDTFYTFPVRETFEAKTAMFQFIGLKAGEWEIHVFAHPESKFKDTVFVSNVEEGKTTDITSIIQLKIIPTDPPTDPAE